MFNFEQPLMLWLLLPVLIGGIYLFKRATHKGLVLSRVIVVALLIVALASPFSINPKVLVDERPNLVLITDETDSMHLFDKQMATRLNEHFTSQTPTTLVKLSGDRTALGDAIMQYATGDNQIVMLTDGNSNSGAELEEALKFAKDIRTTVHYVQPNLISNDVTVQISGDKTVIVNSNNQFNIVVTQAANEEIRYSYELYIDDELAQKIDNVVQNEKQRIIPIVSERTKFKKLGKHTMKLVVTPAKGDSDPINNVFYKSIYVIPKPQILAIGLESSSPLAGALRSNYDVQTASDLSALKGKKALVVNNAHANTFSQSDVEKLKAFLNDGHGILVVGGDRSYNFGNYVDSPIEEILPVVSYPTKWTGGRNVVLLLDVSSSTENHGTAGDVLGNALHIIENENLRDASLGIIAFGTEGYDVSDKLVFLGTTSNRELLRSKIETLSPSPTSQTSLNEGLRLAQQWLGKEAGELDIIIISDGGIEQSYASSLTIAKEIKKNGVNLYYIHIRSQAPSQYDKNQKAFAELLMKEIDGTYFKIDTGERANLVFKELPKPTDDQNTTQTGPYPLLEFNALHFITKNVDVEGAISGYNDVTPKPGAERLIITSTGNPVLTTWRYGLGRVAAISTDNGENGGNRWGTALYYGNNSKLISSTMNWAIGNPREETGAVVEAEDAWYGTASDVVLTMYDTGIPILKLNGVNLDLALTGDNVYETSITPSPIGIHDLSGYPVAVNYALEYRDIGLNEDLPLLLARYNVKTYTESEAKANLLSDARKQEVLIREVVSQKMYFLIAALIIFLGEVIVRRIREIREMRKMSMHGDIRS